MLVDGLDDAVAVANRYAPEHLQVAVADADVDDVVDGLVNAGEILVGQHTPFSAANFVIGCPASLPTSGFAEVSSGITVEAFLKRTAVARADAVALARMSPSIVALADHEGFPAHAAAIRRRDRLNAGSVRQHRRRSRPISGPKRHASSPASSPSGAHPRGSGRRARGSAPSRPGSRDRPAWR